MAWPFDIRSETLVHGTDTFSVSPSDESYADHEVQDVREVRFETAWRITNRLIEQGCRCTALVERSDARGNR